jgi:hypothetical protein
MKIQRLIPLLVVALIMMCSCRAVPAESTSTTTTNSATVPTQTTSTQTETSAATTQESSADTGITFADNVKVQAMPGLYHYQQGIIVSLPGSQQIQQLVESIDPVTGKPTFELEYGTPDNKQEELKIPFNFDGYNATLSCTVVRQDGRIIPIFKSGAGTSADGMVSPLVAIGGTNRYIMDYGISLYILDFDKMEAFKFLPDESDGVTIQDAQAVEFSFWGTSPQVSADGQYLVYQTQRPRQRTNMRLYNFNTGEDRLLASDCGFGGQLVWNDSESIVFEFLYKLYQIGLSGKQEPHYICDATGLWGGSYPNFIIQTGREKTTWLNMETGVKKDVGILIWDCPPIFIQSPSRSGSPYAFVWQSNENYSKLDLFRFDTGDVANILTIEEKFETRTTQWVNASTIILSGTLDGVENTYLIDIGEIVK